MRLISGRDPAKAQAWRNAVVSTFGRHHNASVLRDPNPAFQYECQRADLGLTCDLPRFPAGRYPSCAAKTRDTRAVERWPAQPPPPTELLLVGAVALHAYFLKQHIHTALVRRLTHHLVITERLCFDATARETGQL